MSASMSVVHGAVDVGYVYVEHRNRASLMRQLCRVADEELHYQKLLRAGLLRQFSLKLSVEAIVVALKRHALSGQDLTVNVLYYCCIFFILLLFHFNSIL